MPPARPKTLVLAVSGFATLLLGAALVLLPVPYAVLRPGPVFNTLGQYDNTPLITIKGHPIYPTTGRLDLTTVTVAGGPNGRVNLLDMLLAWLSPKEIVVPEEVEFLPGQTAEQAQHENQAEMVSSQESATAAALSELGIPYKTTMTIAGMQDGSSAAEQFKKGDVIVAVDGKDAPGLTALREELQKVTAGGPVSVTVQRGGKRKDVTVKTIKGDHQRTVLGVYIAPTFKFPFVVRITIDNVGGPSAGTMFSLGIIDKLTPGDMTGGKPIAGTGTMDTDGTVGAIGGIAQKMAGARQAGAQWFLAPAADCHEVVGHVPAGLRIVKISTLAQARAAVEAIGSGKATAPLPTCRR